MMSNCEKIGRIFDSRDYPRRPWLEKFAQGPATSVGRPYLLYNGNEFGGYVFGAPVLEK